MKASYPGHSTVRKSYRRYSIWKTVSWLLLFITLLPALTSKVIISASADDLPPSALPNTRVLTTAATALSGNDSQQLSRQIQSGLINGATSQASASVEQWLRHFGTARVQLNVDQNGNWDQSAIDVLTPLYDNTKSLLFTQFGLRAPNDRFTGNMGFGVRTFNTENWMFGSNFFLDDDFSENNMRIGFGAEAWSNFLKLSANIYAASSGWHSSKDFADYEEKPADGFDIRVESYLPAWPQLGVKTLYEQYYGDKVALFDTDHLQSNPSAVTLGINYTPVPLLSLATNYRRGQDALDDLQLQLDVHYDLAQGWEYQISPENVALQRTLAGSRHDLVERNNQIIMQYRQKQSAGVGKLVLLTLKDNSAADGISRNTLQAQVFNTENQVMPSTSVYWASTGHAVFDATTSMTDANGLTHVSFSDQTSEILNVTATSGGVSSQVQSRFAAVIPAILQLTIDKTGSPADGTTPDDASVKVLDANHNPVPHTAVNWAVSSSASLQSSDAQTDMNGIAHAHITSKTAGPAVLTASSGGLTAQKDVNFIADSQAAAITRFDVIVNQRPADGKTADVAIIEVHDSAGNPVANEPVMIRSDSSTVIWPYSKGRASFTQKTDVKGQLTLRFADTRAETVSISATLNNGDSKSISAEFKADDTSATLQHLKVMKDGSPANGKSENTAEVYVLDSNGNALPNQSVNWQADKTGITFTSSGNTDQTGKAMVSYTSTTAQRFTLTASLKTGGQLSTSSFFVADDASLQITNYALTSGAVANGLAANTATITVMDALHNPAANAEVLWSVSGEARLSSPNGHTDAQGQLSVTLSDTKAETVQVTATLSANHVNETKSTSFIADKTTEVIQSLDVTNTAIANNIDTNTGIVKVVDANNNPLENASVTWQLTGSAKPDSESNKTDSNGQASIHYTDALAEVTTVTASLDNGQHKSARSLFRPDKDSEKISLSVKTNDSLADGLAADKVTALVTDSNGTPLALQTINWSTNSTTAKVTANSKTDRQGQSTVNITDTKGEKVTVTASLPNHASAPIELRFTSYQVQQLLSNTLDQKADGQSAITFVATLTDNTGQPAPEQVVSFAATGHAVLSQAEATTNANGKAFITVTDSYDEKVTVSAKSKAYPSDPGISHTVSFTKEQFTGISVNGHTFTIADHFPTIGMLYAEFTMEINGTTANNGDYTWSSDASWIRINTPGVISFTGSATTKTATITATPISGAGAPLIYRFTLKHWLLNIARSTDNPADADADCAGYNGTVPGYTILSTGKPGEYGKRGTGTFYGEWGDPTGVTSKWSTASPAESMWAAETGSNNTRIFVHWRDGYVNERIPTQIMDEVCLLY